MSLTKKEIEAEIKAAEKALEEDDRIRAERKARRLALGHSEEGRAPSDPPVCQ